MDNSSAKKDVGTEISDIIYMIKHLEKLMFWMRSDGLDLIRQVISTEIAFRTKNDWQPAAAAEPPTNDRAPDGEEVLVDVAEPWIRC